MDWHPVNPTPGSGKGYPGWLHLMECCSLVCLGHEFQWPGLCSMVLAPRRTSRPMAAGGMIPDVGTRVSPGDSGHVLPPQRGGSPDVHTFLGKGWSRPEQWMLASHTAVGVCRRPLQGVPKETQKPSFVGDWGPCSPAGGSSSGSESGEWGELSPLMGSQAASLPGPTVQSGHFCFPRPWAQSTDWL